MFRTGPKLFTNDTLGRTARMLPASSLVMPMPISAMNTAMMILAQAVDVSLGLPLLKLLTEDGELANVLVRPWQAERKTNDQTDDCKRDGACIVVRQGVHGDSEGQDVGTTDED
jgi:hypothetical protein